MKRILLISVVVAALLAGSLTVSSDASAAHCRVLFNANVGNSGFTRYCDAGEGYAAGNSWYYFEYAATDVLGYQYTYRLIKWWWFNDADKRWWPWGCQSNLGPGPLFDPGPTFYTVPCPSGL